MSQATPSKIDPLNRKNYAAITSMLVVGDVKKAYEFCQKAFGFEGRGIMSGPDGNPMHAELKLRESVLMLGPESPDATGSERKDPGQHSNHSLPLRGGRGPGYDAGRQCGSHANPAAGRHVLG